MLQEYQLNLNGFKKFHLGGGRGGQADSLFNFKAGFSSRKI